MGAEVKKGLAFMESMSHLGVIIEDLSVRFPGGVQALDEVSLQFGHGLFGLLGPNGAGKTTLMRTLATLQRPTGGRASVFGSDVVLDAVAVRRCIGYLPQDFQSYHQLRVWEALDFYAVLSGMVDGRLRRERIDSLLGRVGLEESRSRRVGGLSGGMLRRLGVAQALLSQPRLLILDEPTAGLDPGERINFRNLLAELSRDRAVILSTHIVSDIGNSCEFLAVIDRGHLRFNGRTRDLLEKARGKVWRTTVSDVQYSEVRQKYPITSMVDTARGLELKLLKESDREGNCEPAEPNLEDAYLWLLKGDGYGN